MKKFITYDGLPIGSGGAHSLARQSVEKVYSKVIRFIETYTNQKTPTSLDLTLYCSQSRSYDTGPILEDLNRNLGEAKYDKWDLGPVRQEFYTWTLPTSFLKEGLSVLQKYKDLPPNEYGPIVLSLLWCFKFVDTATQQTLPSQEQLPTLDVRRHNSQLYLRLGQNPTISAWFVFPFDPLDAAARSYLTKMLGYLPFKPSDKHWRVWQRSRSDSWTARKLRVDLSEPNLGLT